MAIGATNYDEETLPAVAREALLIAIDMWTNWIHEDLRSLLATRERATLEDGSQLLGFLPGKHRLKYDAAFVKKFLACLTVVGWKLFDSNEHQLSCVAEELSLNGLLMIADGLLSEMEGGGEVDLGYLKETAFRDTDFEFLFDMSLDGLEDTQVAKRMRVVNLAFDQWFSPFGDGYVHPFVGAE